jgi:hypothetical protein
MTAYMKKIVILPPLLMSVLLVLMLLSSCHETEYLVGQLRIGDYVQFGRYADEWILWRVIEDSANPDAKVGDVITGDPLLFSDNVVCKKPFDAAGPHDNNSERLVGGSNLWQTSNLRAWLNSAAEAGAVIWPCGNPPTEDSVDSNDYADEKGFLADGNFNEYERDLIEPVTHRALLYRADEDLAEGGLSPYSYWDEIEDVVSNYDWAWYHNVTDRVFLLDPKQVNGVYNRFGRYYWANYEDYWLCAPDSSAYTDSSAANVLYIRGRDGAVMYRRARSGSIGVRPALILSCESVVFESGDGSLAKPYVITGQ